MVVALIQGGQIASATAEARFDALLPFFGRMYFYVFAESETKLEF